MKKLLFGIRQMFQNKLALYSISIGYFIIIIVVLSVNILKEKNLSALNSNERLLIINKDLSIQNRLLIAKIDSLIKTSNYHTDSIESKIDLTQSKDKISKLTQHIRVLDSSVKALRQAMNPFKPDEILTIARIKDEVDKLKEADNEFINQNISRNQNFEDSIKRELDGSGKNSYLILAVLVPLVLNFLYTVYKDNKPIKPKSHMKLGDQSVLK